MFARPEPFSTLYHSALCSGRLTFVNGIIRLPVCWFPVEFGQRRYPQETMRGGMEERRVKLGYLFPQLPIPSDHRLAVAMFLYQSHGFYPMTLSCIYTFLRFQEPPIFSPFGPSNRNGSWAPGCY